MLTYYNGRYNGYQFRVAPIPANATYLKCELQDMYLLEDNSFLMNPGQWSYDSYESIVSMSFQLTNAYTPQPGSEYRMSLVPYVSGSGYLEPVWHGTLQIFTSQSVNKANYTNQIPLDDKFVSNVSENKYVILP
tara:strand:+ start:98 stop:499 length:402 start_codon:yes stop_codon:yes gene_type:complete